MQGEIRRAGAGDEAAQVEVYNAAAADLPAFKPATIEEVARRWRGEGDTARFVAEAGGRAVGYATANPSGRVSFPWCVPGAEWAREPLLEAILHELARRGRPTAYVAYRADWRPVLGFFEACGFGLARTMINYVAPVDRLPRTPMPPGLRIVALNRNDLPRLAELLDAAEPAAEARRLEGFFWDHPLLRPTSLYVLRDGDGRTCGVGLALTDPRFADPRALDAMMPCFRLGAFGTEAERHKRVNGLVSCLFDDEPSGPLLLTEAGRRLDAAGVAVATGQVPDDRPKSVALFDRYFERQGSFPVLERRLDAPDPGLR